MLTNVLKTGAAMVFEITVNVAIKGATKAIIKLCHKYVLYDSLPMDLKIVLPNAFAKYLLDVIAMYNMPAKPNPINVKPAILNRL